MSDPISFDRIFEEMIKLTESLLDGQPDALLAEPQVEQQEKERDELIERGDSFEYILNAPGYEEGQLVVSVHELGLEVKAPDLIARKEFPSKVDADSAVSKYRNGVLSVTVKKS